jgi:hypothetical protein
MIVTAIERSELFANVTNRKTSRHCDSPLTNTIKFTCSSWAFQHLGIPPRFPRHLHRARNLLQILKTLQQPIFTLTTSTL